MDYIFKCLQSLSVKSLRRVRGYIDKLIESKIPEDRQLISTLDVNDYLQYHSQVVSDSDCLGLMESFTKATALKSSGTQSVWFSTCDFPYSWHSSATGNTTKKLPIKIDANSPILSVMKNINSKLNVSFNSCLVQYYPNGYSGVRLHDDFEPEMSLNDPIAVVTVGQCRPIEFFTNYQAPSETPAKTLTPEQGSMYVMLAGCQEYFRHRVPQDSTCDGWRASFSFRRTVGPTFHDLVHPSNGNETECQQPSSPDFVVISNSAGYLKVSLNDTIESSSDTSSRDHTVAADEGSTTPPTVHTVAADRGSTTPPPPSGGFSATSAVAAKSSSPTLPNTSVSVGTNTSDAYTRQQVSTTVLFGSSMTKFIDHQRLSNSSCKFLNISQPGARLLPIHNKGTNQPWVYVEMLENFATTHKSTLHEVKCVIFSVGTNDLRFFRDRNGRPGDLNVFIRPIEELVARSRKLFGQSVRILFQSVLPMRCQYTYTAANFKGFNKLLRNICHHHNCHFVDWFNDFLDLRGNDIERTLYRDNLHLNRKGYDILHKLFEKLFSRRFVFYENSYSLQHFV